MAPDSPDYKSTVRQEWTGAAPAWKKWRPKLAEQSRSATELILRLAALEPGMRVLDLAGGPGDPALAIAAAVGPQGRVTATDLVPEMLEAAREYASAAGLANIDFRLADAENLDFPDASFDRVTCRFGLMFFPDTQKALIGIRRVLKPGGRAAFVVWGPMDENPLFASNLGPFLKHVSVPPPPPDAPGVFRFAEEAKLAATLETAGFREVRCTKHKVTWSWPGPPEEAWQSTSEIAAPFQKLIAALPAEKRQEVLAEVLENARRFYDGVIVAYPATLVAGSAVS
jgi:SAM-dependent methyltransferase